jgi:pimeloyl-ACP methyl ester carboxylesterase
MWTVRLACLLGLLSSCPGAAAPPAPAALPLHECRLEHPLELSSVAARCGTLAAAEDPDRPQGAHIELAVAVVPALNRRSSAAPLFLLAGGPGQSATDLYVSFAGAFARINRDHAIVLLDQRGTGRSAPLFCAYPDDWQTPGAAAPGTPVPDVAAASAAVREATRACLAKFGDRVRFYTSSVAVRDLDEVRRALGFAQIDLYAASYGTRVAELYLRRHPDAVHAVILDGVTYPEQLIGADTPLDAERALDLILARCQATPDCAAAFPETAQERLDLVRRFGPSSVPLTLSDPSSGAPLAVDFNRSLFDAALRLLSYNATEASLLPLLMHHAAQGRLAPLAAQTIMMAREVGEQLASGMQNSVICSEDVPFYAPSPPERAKLAQTYQGTLQLDALGEICKLWPRGPVDGDLHAALKSAVPTLLLSGEADPVTPPGDAERLARGLSRQRHLVLAGEGHGQLATACIPQLMAEFLNHPDPAGLDASCLAGHHAAPFFVALSGPAP